MDNFLKSIIFIPLEIACNLSIQLCYGWWLVDLIICSISTLISLKCYVSYTLSIPSFYFLSIIGGYCVKGLGFSYCNTSYMA
jgi:hypothetical protein